MKKTSLENQRLQFALICFDLLLAKFKKCVFSKNTFSIGNCMFTVNNIDTRARCEICSKLTIKTPERHQWCRSGVFIVDSKHISHLVLAFLLLTLSR